MAGGPPSPAKRSFADVLGASAAASAIANCFIKRPSLHRGEPALIFSKDEVQKMSSGLQFALVGKFSRGRPPMASLRKSFTSLDLKGSFQLGLLDSRHVLIRVDLEVDFLRLRLRKILNFDGFAMRLFRWTPQFRLDLESTWVPIWVRFDGLPLYMFNKGALFSLGSILGDPLKIDASTTSLSRPSAARICVDIDIQKGRPNRIWLEDGERGFWQSVDYEDVPSLCSICMKVGHSAEKCNRGRTEKKTSTQQQWLPKVSTNSNVLVVRASAHPPTVTEIVQAESSVVAVFPPPSAADLSVPVAAEVCVADAAVAPSAAITSIAISAAVLDMPTSSAADFPSAADLSVPVVAEVRVADAAVAPSAAITSSAVSAAPVVAAELDVPVAAEVVVAAAVTAPVASVSLPAVTLKHLPTVNAAACVAVSPALHSKAGVSVIDGVSSSAASVAKFIAQSGEVFERAVDVSKHPPTSAIDLASSSVYVAAAPLVVATDSCSTHTAPLVSSIADIATAEAAHVPLVTDFGPPLKGILNANAPLFNPQNHPFAWFSKSFAEALLGETRPLNVSEEPLFFAVKSLEFPNFQMPQFAEFYTSSSFAPPDETSTSLTHEDIYTFSDGDDVPRWPASRDLISASLKSFNKQLQDIFSMHSRFFHCPTQRKKLKKRPPISTSDPGLSTGVSPPLNALTFHGPNPYEEQLNDNDPVKYESVWRSSSSEEDDSFDFTIPVSSEAALMALEFEDFSPPARRKYNKRFRDLPAPMITRSSRNRS